MVQRVRVLGGRAEREEVVSLQGRRAVVVAADQHAAMRRIEAALTMPSAEVSAALGALDAAVRQVTAELAAERRTARRPR